jgi:hypothetical protein
MLMIAAGLAGLLTVPLFGGRLSRLAEIRFRHTWLVFAAIFAQFVIISVIAERVNGRVGEVVHLATYALAVAFIVANRQIAGMMVIALGASMNLAAIAANGGVMPASATAWRIARGSLPDGTTFENSLPVSDPRLGFLGDVLAIPAGWPFANVFSLGDVVLVAGVTYLAHRWCRAAMPAEAANAEPADLAGAR